MRKSVSELYWQKVEKVVVRGGVVVVGVVVVVVVVVLVVAASTDHVQFLLHFGRLCCAGIHALQLIRLSNLIFNSRKSFSAPEADKIKFENAEPVRFHSVCVRIIGGSVHAGS